MQTTNNIYPCLWFDGNAHEAADFYLSIFPNSKLLSKTPFVAVMELNGQRFMTLNGGPEYEFSPATSFVVSCNTQEEIDFYWEKLTSNGKEGKCGWLTDQFGVSWQIVPRVLSDLMRDSEKAPRVMFAFMQMKKLIIEDLINA